MKKRALAVLAVLILGTGLVWLNWTPQPPSGTPPAPPVPVAITLEPNSGPPGTEVTVRIRLKEPEKAWAGHDGQSWNFQLCWGKCVSQQWAQTVWPKPSPEDPHLFVGTVQVPSFINGVRQKKGTVEVLLACTLAPEPDCLSRPESRTTFRLSDELRAVAWQAMPTRSFQSVPALDRSASPAADPTNPDRQLRCVSGSPNPDVPDRPHLRVTTDAWKTWKTIPLTGVHLGAMAGISGCRAATLDPVAPESFYVAGGGHRGASGPGRFPRPAYTADGGATWNPVPPPQGYDALDFLGYTASPESVTAWFAQPDKNGLPLSFAGSRTRNGGRTWETAPLECPMTGPCAWEVPTALYSRLERGLLRSEDGGKSWLWAEWEGARLQGRNRGFPIFHISGETMEMLLADGSDDFSLDYAPLLQSADGGRTWTWVDLPEPPGGWMRDPDLQMGADGSLLYRNAQDIRFRLPQGVAAWERQ